MEEFIFAIFYSADSLQKKLLKLYFDSKDHTILVSRRKKKGGNEESFKGKPSEIPPKRRTKKKYVINDFALINSLPRITMKGHTQKKKKSVYISHYLLTKNRILFALQQVFWKTKLKSFLPSKEVLFIENN